MEELLIAGTVLSVGSGAFWFLYRRFKRAAPKVPSICHVAAAFARIGGGITLIAGVGHSVAVASLAYSLNEYGALQVLWFTTGVMLVYTGALNVVMAGGITAGRGSAIWVATAASVLFVVYLLFLNPLPSGGGTVPPMLAAWSLYVLSLIVAGVAASRSQRARVASPAV